MNRHILQANGLRLVSGFIAAEIPQFNYHAMTGSTATMGSSNVSTAPETEGPKEIIYVSADDARNFVQSVLIGNGAPISTAAHVAKCLVAADLRGVDTHGMHRIPSYMERIRKGVLDPKIEPEVKYVWLISMQPKHLRKPPS